MKKQIKAESPSKPSPCLLDHFCPSVSLSICPCVRLSVRPAGRPSSFAVPICFVCCVVHRLLGLCRCASRRVPDLIAVKRHRRPPPCFLQHGFGYFQTVSPLPLDCLPLARPRRCSPHADSLRSSGSSGQLCRITCPKVVINVCGCGEANESS